MVNTLTAKSDVFKHMITHAETNDYIGFDTRGLNDDEVHSYLYAWHEIYKASQWAVADLLLSLSVRKGNDFYQLVSAIIDRAPKTIANWLHVAEAWPVEQRQPDHIMTFSDHQDIYYASKVGFVVVGWHVLNLRDAIVAFGRWYFERRGERLANSVYTAIFNFYRDKEPDMMSNGRNYYQWVSPFQILHDKDVEKKKRFLERIIDHIVEGPDEIEYDKGKVITKRDVVKIMEYYFDVDE